MEKLVVHQEKIKDAKSLIDLCPFGAIEQKADKVIINDSCRMCKLCVKKGPKGAVEHIAENEKEKIDKNKWQGIMVYVEHTSGKIHPVTYELIGKANELAKQINQPVYLLFIGHNIENHCKKISGFGAHTIFIYDHSELSEFRIVPYTNVFTDFIKEYKPSVVLVGATSVGRQLAPRVAAKMRTGLTADCTTLKIKKDSDLIQIRPAFGGNIMAEIVTPNNRPQMATVRYKVMDAAKTNSNIDTKIKFCEYKYEKYDDIKVLGIDKKPQETFIESADVLVVAGRGVKRQEDLKMLEAIAEKLGGQLACTRPLCEKGWVDPKKQIGLSGRTVRPKLIITCGVSGAIQFVSGMENSDTIVAINTDENAPIFKVAHFAIVGDMYNIMTELSSMLQNMQQRGN